MKNYKLKIKQLDKQLMKFAGLSPANESHNNWFKLVRDALGMSFRYLSKKMNITYGRVAQLEKAESDGSITLRNLEKLADAVECKLVYYFVPKESLEAIVKEQAKKVARLQIDRVNSTMQLEMQGTSRDELMRQYQDLVNELVESNPKKLWRMPDDL